METVKFHSPQNKQKNTEKETSAYQRLQERTEHKLTSDQIYSIMCARVRVLIQSTAGE